MPSSVVLTSRMDFLCAFGVAHNELIAAAGSWFDQLGTQVLSFLFPPALASLAIAWRAGSVPVTRTHQLKYTLDPVN